MVCAISSQALNQSPPRALIVNIFISKTLKRKKIGKMSSGRSIFSRFLRTKLRIATSFLQIEGRKGTKMHKMIEKREFIEYSILEIFLLIKAVFQPTTLDQGLL